MAKAQGPPAAVALGRLGGLAADGRGGRVRWANVPVEERSKIMSELVTRCHWKAKRKKRST
jgi:hypothetical protein